MPSSLCEIYSLKPIVRRIMSKKKVAKKPASKKPAKKPAKKYAAPDTLKALPFEDQVKNVLNHVLSVLKAALLDAFRQYVESMIKSEGPASVEEFCLNFKNTIALHGTTPEELIESLDDDYAKEYVRNSAVKGALKAVPAKPAIVAEKPAPAVAAPTPAAAPASPTPAAAPASKSVFDSLDIL